MTTAKVTSKGKETISASIRVALNPEQSSKIDEAEKLAIFPVTGSIHELKGVLRKPARPVSIADMNLYRHT